MSATAITPIEKNWNSLFTLAGATDFLEVNASTKEALIPAGPDSRLLLAFYNSDSSSAYDVTVKAGDGYMGAASGRVLTDLAAGSYALAVVESSQYGQYSGENRGNILVSAESGSIKVAAFILP